MHIDRDIEGWCPTRGQLARDGEPVDDRIYTVREFDRTLVIDGRTKAVAEIVTAFLKESGDCFQKAIIFCVDQEHAARMRQALVNENADLVRGNARYVMRITGEDETGKNELGNFIDPESKYPVLVTTSRLLSTGVDVQTCRLIVLDRVVGSMTEFKQIVGRGTRVHEDTEKYYFTLIDLRGAAGHFADPEFDGEPEQIYEPGPDDPVLPPDPPPNGPDGPGEGEIIIDGGDPPGPPPTGPGPQKKIYVDGIEATVVAERVEYLDGNGKLITESLRDFTRRALPRRFASLDDSLNRWSGEERKQAIVDEMAAEGLPLAVIVEELGSELDPFDLICHFAFDAKPLTRRERAENVKKQKFPATLDDRPFPVPENWCWARVREIASDRGQKVSDRPFTYIDVSAIDKTTGLVAGPRVVEPAKAPSRARKVARPGDVVCSCVRPYLLNVAIIEDDFDPPPIASTAFEVLDGHGFVLPRYIWTVLRSPFMIACVEQSQRGQACPAINSADFAVLPFPLPPLAEQRRIVAKVDELTALCDQLEAGLGVAGDTCSRLLDSLLHEWLGAHEATFNARAGRVARIGA